MSRENHEKRTDLYEKASYGLPDGVEDAYIVKKSESKPAVTRRTNPEFFKKPKAPTRKSNPEFFKK